MLSTILAGLLPLAGVVSALPQLETRALAAVTNKALSLEIVYQNNLNYTDDVNHLPYLLLSSVKQSQAAAACSSFGETEITPAQVSKYKDDFTKSLDYLQYAGTGSSAYIIQNGLLSVGRNGAISVRNTTANGYQSYPVLCTNSQGKNYPTTSNTVTVASSGNTYTGYRKDRDFTFRGVPFADKPTRFQYSKVYSAKGQNLTTTQYSAQCAQASSGSEDCLYLNIDTPYIPQSGCEDNLKPVIFWIHGGGFTGGNGQTDGSQLASREDTVFVSIQYRLSTLGFLAIPGTNITGNYGFSDQVTALQWTRKNIANFGGDPNKITIMGESAGAGSVRVLLGSPPAIGKYRGAIALSNLGGGVDLGLSGDYSTTYSSYLTIAGAYNQYAGLAAQAGCNETALADVVACLTAAPALPLVEQSIVARYPVQDGVYINTEQLIVNVKNSSTAHVPVIFGILRDDGASFVNYPKTNVTSEVAGLQEILYISEAYAESVINSGLFPLPNTGNLTLDTFNVSARIQTDQGFRCVDQATVYAGTLSGAFPSAYFYQFDRSIAGYDPNGVGSPPATAQYPNGDPYLPYFRVHAGDLDFSFGSISPSAIRDPADLYTAQLVSGYFTEFARSLQPNPPQQYLQIRGYTQTLEAVQESGPWQPVAKGSDKGPIRLLDYPPSSSPYLELDQCKFLNYTLDYYINANRG